MYAPVCSRFVTYDVALDDDAAGYSRTMMDYPYAAAKLEPDELEELDVEF